jgi:hypothetical protein
MINGASTTNCDEELCDELNKEAGDLHTHLLGMGNYHWWMYRLMGREIPSLVAKASAQWEAGAGADGGETEKKIAEVSTNRKKREEDEEEEEKEVASGSAVREPADDMDPLAWYEEVPKEDRTALMKLPLDNHRKVAGQRARFNDLVRRTRDGDDTSSDFTSGLRMWLSEERNEPAKLELDVVFSFGNLLKGLGIGQNWGVHCAKREIGQVLCNPALVELELAQPHIIFNAREQRFDLVQGIRNETMRELVGLSRPAEARTNSQEAAFMRVANAFSMLSQTAGAPHEVVLSTFRGHFTPTFYPGRYAMKDNLYEQYLETLTLLLRHVCGRYERAGVTYVEFSIGVGDVCRPWVMDALVPDLKKQVMKGSSDDRPVKYFYLAGFSRSGCEEFLRTTFPDELRSLGIDLTCRLSPQDAYALLRTYPSQCSQFLRNGASLESWSLPLGPMRQVSDAGGIHGWAVDKLKVLERHFWSWGMYRCVAGLDLMGDEMGYPYIPFVRKEFVTFVKKCHEFNPRFGIRIHGGESVPPMADRDAYVLHMKYLTHSLMLLSRVHSVPLRVGHGIALVHWQEEVLRDSRNRTPFGKNDVAASDFLFACLFDQMNIPLEVNITSNIYLLPAESKGSDDAGTADTPHSSVRAIDKMLRLNWPVVLSTDNDGVWIIRKCSAHYEHISVKGEMCRYFYHSSREDTRHESVPLIMESIRQMRCCSVSNDTKFFVEKGWRSKLQAPASPIEKAAIRCHIAARDLVTLLWPGILKIEHKVNQTGTGIASGPSDTYDEQTSIESSVFYESSWLTQTMLALISMPGFCAEFVSKEKTTSMTNQLRHWVLPDSDLSKVVDSKVIALAVVVRVVLKLIRLRLVFFRGVWKRV